MKLRLLEMTVDELRRAVATMGHKPYRAEQLADWVYKKAVTDPAGMTNMPRAILERFEILPSRIAARADSRDGCAKLLLDLGDGRQIETVLIPSAQRATACVSTQAGCAMGCAFCATGMDTVGGRGPESPAGKVGRLNLTGGQIVAQLLHLRQATGQAITNVVFMGMGEPLANYDATVAAIRAIVDPERFGISARRVTVSTVGLPRQIRRLARENLPVTLAISLHAPNDAIRRQLVPSAATWSIEEILAAAEEYYRARKREITLEYVLLAGVNDSAICAEALAQIARRLRCNVNLLLYNPTASLPFERPSQAATSLFAQRLARGGVNVHVRHSRGLDADAACGQLRHRTGAEGQR